MAFKRPVQIRQMDYCCGAYFLFDFATGGERWALTQTRQYYGRNSLTQEEADKLNDQSFRESKKDHHSRVRTSIQEHINTWTMKKSYLLAITNKLEKDQGVEEILKDLGWEVMIPETRNPTGSSITMWVYHLLPKVKEKTKSALKW